MNAQIYTLLKIVPGIKQKQNLDLYIITTQYILYRGRVEMGGVYLDSLSAGAYTTTLYVMVDIVKRADVHPHSHQAEQIFPS